MTGDARQATADELTGLLGEALLHQRRGRPHPADDLFARSVARSMADHMTRAGWVVVRARPGQ